MGQLELTSTSDAFSAVVPVHSGAAVTYAPVIRRFTVDEYHRLGETGILGGDERLELLEGIVTMMSPIGLSHGQCVFKLTKRLETLLPRGWQVVSQQSIATCDSEPVPDVIVLRGDLLQYTELPKGKDIGLVVEVAETTLRQDRQTKSPIYAAAVIPEYWIVNLVERRLEVYRRPVAASGESPARYETVELYGPEQSVDVALDGAAMGTLPVKDMLP